jgi:hypothetical protein
MHCLCVEKEKKGISHNFKKSVSLIFVKEHLKRTQVRVETCCANKV